MEKKECKHEFSYQSEGVNLHDVNKGWYVAKRIVIFCKNCGKVTHDNTNGNSSFGQDYSHKK